MSKILVVLSKEESNTSLIYLYREGIFYVAYEFSCYAFYKLFKQYKLKKRLVKLVGKEVVSLDFPVGCLSTVIKQRAYTETEEAIRLELSEDEQSSNNIRR